MTTRTVAARLRLEIADWTRNAATVVKTTKDMGDAAEELARRGSRSQQQQAGFMAAATKSARENQQAWTTAGTAATAFGAATLAGVGLAIATYSRFDEAMSSVQAATHETTDNMEALREAAIQAGADTAFSASEAAQGIEELAKAGVSTADILGGGLAGALDLAAAGGIGVGEAAETAASAMTQFRLGGEQVTHIADLLAAGAGKAQGGVSDMAQALNQAGLVSSQMGLSIEETVGSLTAFASAGLVGSDAGTSFRAMLLRLANPTKENIGLIRDLGLQFYDAQGDFVGMESVAGQLQDRLAGLTQEQRNAALAQIFGQDAIRAASILYTEGAEGIAEWTSAVDESGYAAQTAELRMDNLRGDLEALGGSWETFLIRMGESADSPLRWVVQALDSIVDTAGNLPGPVMATVGALTAFTGATSLGAGALLLGLPRYIEFRDSLSTLAEIAPRAASGIGTVATGVGRLARYGAAVGVTAVALGALANAAKDSANARPVQDIADAIERIAMYGDSAAQLGISQIFSDMPEFLGMATMEATNLQDVFDKLLSPSTTDRVSEFFGSMGLPSYLEDYKQAAEEADAALTQMLDVGGTDGQAAREFIEGLGYSTEELAEILPGANEQLARTGEEALAAAEGLGVATTNADGTALSASELAAATDEASEALEKWSEMVMKANDSFVSAATAYDTITAKTREWAEGQAAATDSAEDSWEDFFDGSTVSMADWIAELNAQNEALANWQDNIFTITAQIREQLPADMHAAADAMLDELIAMGPEGAAALQTFREASTEEKQALVDAWLGTGYEITDNLASELNEARKPEVDIDADTTNAEESANGFVDGVDEMSGSIPLDAEPRLARAVLEGMLLEIDGADGVLKINGDPANGMASLDSFLSTVGLSSEDVTINGDPVNGDAALQLFINRIRGSDEDVDIGGNNAEGRTALRTLVNLIRNSEGAVTITANTGSAYERLNSFMRDANGRTVTVYSRMVNLGQAEVATGGYMAFHAAAIGLAGGGTPKRFPYGGQVHGPGTTTSDSIPAWLSRTEFVQRAAAVDYYGVDAMYALNGLRADRDAIRTAIGLAGGGQPVYRQYQPAPQARTAVHTAAPAPVNVVAYVTNPFTGEQVRAAVRTEADGRIRERERQSDAYLGGEA